MTEETVAGRARPNIRMPSEPEAPALRREALRETSLRDSKDAAALRAAELRGHLEGRFDTDAGDEFDVSSFAPDGWTYQWATWSIYEQRQIQNMMQIEAKGWTPVPRTRHPQLMPKDSTLDVIIHKGNILMEMPTEIVEEYRRAEVKNARNQVRWKEEAIAGTPDGTLPRDHVQVRPKINKSYEAVPIPDK